MTSPESPSTSEQEATATANAAMLFREALERIKNELGLPVDGYPQNVANAWDIADAALNGHRFAFGGNPVSLGPFLQPPATVTIRPCPLCSEGWVCEAHPGKGWPHNDCAGPGMPCQQCTQAAYPTAAEQPATDLGAMVKAILRQTSLAPGCMTMDAWAVHLTLIHDTAQRLAVALEQREAVMGDMAKALEAEEAVGVHFAKCSYELSGCETPTEDDGQEVFCKEYRRLAEMAGAMRCGALGQYEEARQPREASSTEGEQ